MVLAAGVIAACTPPSLTVCGSRCDDDPDDSEPTDAGRSVDTPDTPGTTTGKDDIFAFGGGKSIAVRWVPKSSPTAFDVYRDGKSVGHVTPGWHGDFPEKDGYGFIDTGISAGKTYKYSVKGLDDGGKVVWESSELTTTASSFTAEPTVTVNTRGDAQMEKCVNDYGLPFFKIWYPKIIAQLADPDYSAPSSFGIDFDPDYKGLAQAENNQLIRISPGYVRDNQKDLGVLIHEATHIVQVYGNGAPGWFVEGTADWVREQMLHDRDPKPLAGPLDPMNGYSPAAYMLAWIEAKYDPGFVPKWNKLAHVGTPPFASMFFDNGKKAITDVWADIAGTTSSFGPVTGANSLCMGPSGDRYNDPPIVVSKCDGSHQQRWTLYANKDDGTVSFLNAVGQCIDIDNAGTANDTRLKLHSCSFNLAQRWKAQSNGTYQNPNSGRCIEAANNGASGAYLRLYDCSGAANQRWSTSK